MREDRLPELEHLVEAARSRLAAADPAGPLGAALDELAAELRGALDARERPGAAAARLLPPFVHLDPAGLLPGEIDLATPAAGADPAAPRALLTALRLEAAELLNGVPPERLARAAAPVGSLTERSGPRLELVVELAGGRLLVFAGDERGRAPVPVDELPAHERWRLTLDLLLAAAGAPAVLLLDQPDECFRRAENGALRVLLGRYADAGHTVLYTASLPFRVELQHPEQVLVLAPTAEGPRVTRGLFDGREPEPALRAALGMSGRSSFSIAESNLVVEGPGDAALVAALADLFERSGEPGLPADLQLTAAGGAHEVTAVAAFLVRQGLGAVALFDSDGAGAAARRDLERDAAAELAAGRLAVHSLSPAAGMDCSACAIEDLFPRPLYLEVARAVCAEEGVPFAAAASDTAEDGKLASRLKRRFAAAGHVFPKGRVVEALAQRLRELQSVAELPGDLAPRARRLLATLRESAGGLR